MLKHINIIIFLAVLTGCGGSSEVTETAKPVEENGPFVYTGPAPKTSDIQQYKIQFWDNIVTDDKCGACHNQNGQSPQFARSDDINLAYNDVNSLINREKPEESLLIQKVAGGHNCWLSSTSACTDILTVWIANWANTEQSANEIQLSTPIIKEPGANKRLPDDATLFAAHVYPITKTYCANCHASNATIPISPYFAENDVEIAYLAAKSKIDLNSPELSRFVLRLKNEFHNCWDNCSANGNEMLNAIQEIANNVATTVLDDEIINSKALTLPDGIVASGGSRFEQNVIAKYQFKTGTGSVAYDTSGIEPALDLNFNGDVNWVGGWGIKFGNGRAQGNTADSKKLYDLITATGEYSIETWVTPANVTQEGPARIISYSGGKESRNFTLGQTLYNYEHLLRTSNTNANGTPSLTTDDADEDLQASLQHVVINYDPVEGRKIYVNGVYTDDADTIAPGTFQDWDPSFALILGNETSGDLPWAGTIRMLAIHNRVLNQAQITQNYEIGVGERFYLLFSISDLISIPDSYIVMEVSQYDSYSYLFKEPFFISLDESANPQNISVQGIRIGINGAEPQLGQAFKHLDTNLGGSTYSSQTGQKLSRLGTLIPLENGSQADEFFLTFERLGTHENIRIEPEPPVISDPADLEPQSQLGIKIFSEINAGLSQMTTVSSQNTAVKSTFDNLQQQLPAITDINGFLASNQMAISQLAIKYCNALIEDTNLRQSYFPGFNFTANVADALNGANRDLLIDPLIYHALPAGTEAQADPQLVKQELNNLIDKLSQCTVASDCNNARSLTIAKASCAALMGSAVNLLQ